MDILKAVPRWITIGINNTYTVQHGKGLIILGGMIRHITASNSILKVSHDKIVGGVTIDIPMAWVPLASASATYPMFNLSGVVDVTQWSPMIFTEGFVIDLTGDADAFCVINILEFDV